MITYVALPYQIYQITQSSFAVGMMGVVELIPLLITAFLGGAYADSMDRRKLLLGAEFGLSICTLILMVNSTLPQPKVEIIYLTAALMSALNGFHRPALEALTPRLVERKDILSVSALTSLRSTLGMIAGPAIGGICIASLGLPITYGIDVATFVLSLIALALMKKIPAPENAEPPSINSVMEGLRYAKSRQELIGTYLVDIIAMVFGMPMALFPAIAESFGGAHILGWLYSAPSTGALCATLLSGWTRKIHRHGAGVILSAITWGIAITLFGFSTHIGLALFFLGLAGAADMYSGIFRTTIWNETIPDRLRGRLAGVELLSYSSGPLLGNAESGLIAALIGTRASVISGGVICVLGVGLSILFLPKFWKYDSQTFHANSKA
jgi:MFS family permease